MESLGQYLKTQRKLRNMELSSISAETKIAMNWLKAIEEDRWNDLPANTFARGFVKSYAKAVGLDVEGVMLSYEDLVKGSGEEIGWVQSVIEENLREKPKIFWVAIVMIILIAVGALLFWIL